MTTLGDPLTLAECDQFFELVDKDNSGGIDFEEFVEFVCEEGPVYGKDSRSSAVTRRQMSDNTRKAMLKSDHCTIEEEASEEASDIAALAPGATPCVERAADTGAAGCRRVGEGEEETSFNTESLSSRCQALQLASDAGPATYGLVPVVDSDRRRSSTASDPLDAPPIPGTII